jgi:hypothetical protein
VVAVVAVVVIRLAVLHLALAEQVVAVLAVLLVDSVQQEQ